MCNIAPLSQRGWLCESFSIPPEEFDPFSDKLPLGRLPNSWWECGCEDMNTYTQAFCREPLIGIDEQDSLNRIRYASATNVVLWTVYSTEGSLIWNQVQEMQVLGAMTSQLMLAATALALVLQAF